MGIKSNLRHFQLLTLSVLFILSACAAVVEVKSTTLDIKHVCIQENSKAEIDDFLDLLRDGFSRNGISSEVYLDAKPASCEYLVSYVAIQGWELLYGKFLRDAQIRIRKDGRNVASSSFHVGAGFVSAKSQTAKESIDSMMNEMLKK
jgi:hypothetical protein